VSKELLERVYQEISNGNVQPLLDSLADDITWTIIGSTPLSGVYRGRDEVTTKLLAGLRARLATPVRFTIERLISEDDYVVMQANGHATTIDGLAYDNTYCIIARITNGKLHELTDYVDTELITNSLFARRR
jgi:ketosteroid isomerase-like protein